MSKPESMEATKVYPDVWGFKIKQERKERIVIKGIELIIKRYTTHSKTKGIRVPLKENKGILFRKFNEFLASCEKHRPPEEKVTQMFSATTLSEVDKDLDRVFNLTERKAGFYVYKSHIIFVEDENSAPPMERLIMFIEYYKKKFKIQTKIKSEMFSELDELEINE